MKRWPMLCIPLFVFLIVTFSPQHTALACSGGYPVSILNLETDLDEGVIVVRGTGTGRVGKGEVHVKEYIIGEPDYSLLRLLYYGKGRLTAESVGYYAGSCGYGALYPTDHEAYYVMRRHQDGTYRITHIITFPSEYPQFVDSTPERNRYHLTEDEFLERINANPRPPLFADIEFPPNPLLNPMLIRTRNDSLYLLPVDATVPEDIVLIAENVRDVESIDTFIGITTDESLILHERLSGYQWRWPLPQGVDCTVMTCITFSKNGLFVILQRDANAVRVCELALIFPNSSGSASTKGDPCRQSISPTTLYIGKGVRTTPDSNYLAIWQGEMIVIYGSESWSEDVRYSGDAPPLQASTSLELPTSGYPEDWFAGRGVWSSDSRWLAYSDARGLWLWDVFTQAPQHVLPASLDGQQIPYARFFSPSGRYLAVSMGEQHFIMDRFSGLVFPDGVIRPDERMLLRRDTVNEAPVPAEMCSLLNGECTPLIPSNPEALIKKAFWRVTPVYSDWYTCYMMVNEEEKSTCWTVKESGEYEIEFEYFLRPIDARGVLDSPIVSLTPLVME